MIKGVYQAFLDTQDQPIAVWEAIRDACQDPKERAHMDIAITARKRLEGTS